MQKPMIVVKYPKPIECPHCKRDRTLVRQTVKPMRLHVCLGCGKYFKSYEE